MGEDRVLEAETGVPLKLQAPLPVEQALTKLRQGGYEAYLVGGCVRDALLGRAPKDWDITTSAHPEQVLALFKNAQMTPRFGTVFVSDGAGGTLEITTYRTEGVYSDHRRPDAVAFTPSLLVDLERRDFTINAMAYADGVLVDPHGGSLHLQKRILAAVGDAQTRFGEDALRILRAARFVAQLDLAPASELVVAMTARASEVKHLSQERILAEFERLLTTQRPSVGLRLLSQTGVLAYCFPELAATVGVVQSKKGGRDVFEHTLATIDAVPSTHSSARILRWAALCHDLGKPVVARSSAHTQGTIPTGLFHDHDQVGARVAQGALRRLKMDEASLRAVVHLVRHHMFWFSGEWTGAATRRFIHRVGLEQVPLLLELRRADVRGGGKQYARFPALDILQERVDAEIQARSAFSLRDMALDGSDLLSHFSLTPGPRIGSILNSLFEEVLDDPTLNERRLLLARAQVLLEQEYVRG